MEVEVAVWSSKQCH